MNISRSQYLKNQEEWVEKTGLRVGDTVRVLFAAPENHLGWDNSWSGSMAKGVESGNYTVEATGKMAGILLSDGYYYPYYCLQIVEPNKITVKGINIDGEVQIVEGEVHIGYYVIPFDEFDRIVQAVEKARGNRRPYKVGDKVPFCEVREGDSVRFTGNETVYTRNGVKDGMQTLTFHNGEYGYCSPSDTTPVTIYAIAS